MNKLGWLIVMFFACGVCDAQNLVPNGDFEQYSGCPVVLGDFDSLLYWFNPCLPPYGGGINQSGSPDYINVCNNSGIVDVPSN